MRSILVALTMVVFLVVTLPVYLVITCIGFFNKGKCAAASQCFINFAFRLLLREAGAKMTVLGLENIPKDVPVLFVANHRSYADVPMIYTTCGRTTGIVAKKEIKKVPILSLWMVNMLCLFLDRDDVRKALKTIQTAIKTVKEGFCMCIMPEGTRNHGEEMLPFKEGSLKIAEKSGCPIIPVAITNSDGLYELSKPWVKSARVAIHYGEPISTANISREEKKELSHKVQDSIAKMLESDKKYVK